MIIIRIMLIVTTMMKTSPVLMSCRLHSDSHCLYDYRPRHDGDRTLLRFLLSEETSLHHQTPGCSAAFHDRFVW